MKLHKISSIELSTQIELGKNHRRIIQLKLFKDGFLVHKLSELADGIGEKWFRHGTNGYEEVPLATAKIDTSGKIFVVDETDDELNAKDTYVTHKFCCDHENCVVYRYYNDDDKLIHEDHQKFYQPTPHETLIFKKNMPIYLK